MSKKHNHLIYAPQHQVNSEIKFSSTTSPQLCSKRCLLYYDTANKFDAGLEHSVNGNWQIETATSLCTAQELCNEHTINVGLFCVGSLNHENILQEIDNLLLLDNHVLWIALLPRSRTDDAEVCRLIAHYFFDYHTLPLDKERLLVSLGHVFGMASLRQKTLLNLPDTKSTDTLVGTSRPMQQLRKDLLKVADTRAPILISGESGTGKELVANTIHKHSRCSSGPFIAVNCGAVPATLIQSELFGHEKGAFTGAHQRHIGRFEAANGGTLFLDEIGDLPLDLQTNLLRFLEEKTIERVGSTRQIHVNARVIAASHVNIEEAVKKGRFREDLYFRLNVIQLEVPRLADRGQDIELLASYFLQRFCEHGGCLKAFSQGALRVMESYAWPGNVRELMNRVRRAVVMSEGKVITVKDLGLERRTVDRPVLSLNKSRVEADKNAITSALTHAHNNVSKAARNLGISRTTLYRLMEKFGINS